MAFKDVFSIENTSERKSREDEKKAAPDIKKARPVSKDAAPALVATEDEGDIE